MEANKEDTFNVMVLAAAISLLVMACSVIALWILTGDAYLDLYFTLEAFFNVQNTAASEALAAFAFSSAQIKLIPILLVVTIDNISRIMIVSFIIAAVIDFLNYANVEGIINDMRASGLKDHVILCEYNTISDRLIKDLKAQRSRYMVIEPEKAKENELEEKRILNIRGDFTSEEMLKTARIEKARAIVFVSENDVDNVVGAIAARKLNPGIRIEIRLSDEQIRKKVYGIGADMAVIPEYLAGIELGEYITRIFGA